MTLDEIREAQFLTGGVLPASFYPQEEPEPHLVWYGTKTRWPSDLEKMFVMCRKCDSGGLKDGHVKATDFELHLIKEHALTPDSYVQRFGEYLGATEFPVLHHP